MKRRLFVGSSVTSLKVAYAIQENLEYDFEVTVWNQGIFDLSKVTIESLFEALDDFDFAAFVFTPDDILTMNNEEKRVVRDNVLFELGLFFGRLGRERAFIIQPRDIKDFRIPTDLLGLTPAHYKADREDGSLVAALGPACEKIRRAALKAAAKAQSETPPDPAEFDENDCISIIESWIGSRPRDTNSRVFVFSDVDNELRLPPGSAAKHLEEAAARWNLQPYRRGQKTVLFKHKQGA